MARAFSTYGVQDHDDEGVDDTEEHHILRRVVKSFQEDNRQGDDDGSRGLGVDGAQNMRHGG